MAQAENEATVDDEVQVASPEDETTEHAAQPADEGGEGEGGGEEDDEVVVSIGEESPTSEAEQASAPEWVRELRKSNREKDRKLREQEAEIARLRGPGNQPSAVVVGEKPTLESCAYDAGAFERELEAWHQRKREAEAQQAQAAQAQQKVQEAWQARLTAYGKGKSELKVKDFEDAEEAVKAATSLVQQGVILDGADNSAVVIYALGKNPARLKKLAAITNPVKFAFAVAKLETQLKVTPKKTAPPPERTVRSSVAGATAVDNTLEKLREEAHRTGNLSKVVAYNRQKRRE